MSLLDDNLDINWEEYYTDKIVKFFKENGPNGFGISEHALIEPKYLFQVCHLEEVVNKPRNYELWAAKVRNKYFLKIYQANVIEWGGYVSVQKKKIGEYGMNYLSKVYMSDILEV